MDIPKDIYQRITKKHGTILNLQSNPAILEDILRELRSIEQDDFADYQKKTASPFNVPWMDSWAANWLLHQQSSSSSGQSEREFNSVLGQLIDLKFRERLNELKKFIGRYAEPPDAGPPEPGTPPAGPQSIFASPPPDPPPPNTFRSSPPPPPDEFRAPPPPDPEDPDASFRHAPPPDPEDPDASFRRSPPPPDPEDPDSSVMGARRFASTGFNPVTEPPDGGPPEPGVPDPPAPQPPGPDGAGLRDNPWILYWFVSINAPLILNMIDAHITRRLNDLKTQTRKK